MNPFTCRNQTPLGPLRYRFFIRVQNNKRSRDNKKLETEIPVTEPYQDFLFAMNSPVTRERYSTRLRSFFVGISEFDYIAPVIQTENYHIPPQLIHTNTRGMIEQQQKMGLETFKTHSFHFG
jgi:hypothetical protein